MKFTNPFNKTNAPDQMVEGRNLYYAHVRTTVVLTVGGALLGALYAPFIVYTWKSHAPMSGQTLGYLWEYTRMMLSNRLWEPHLALLYKRDFVPISLNWIGQGEATQLKALFAYASCGLAGGVLGLTHNLTQPHTKMIMKADASWCAAPDLRAMERLKQVGVRGGFLMALGRWQGGTRDGQMVQMIETLSALCLAPPGTGKTAGFVIPSLISNDTVSFIVNDPKPELFQACGGHKARTTNLFMLDWSKIDVVPMRPVLDEDGRQALDAVGKPMEEFDYANAKFYPRINPLSPLFVPPIGPDRDTYIDAVCKTLIPEKGGGGDSYFVDKGRAALTGFFHAMIAMVGDAGLYDGLPKDWVGMEPSIPMFVDWMAMAQYNASQGGQEDDDGFQGDPEEREPPPPAPEDPIGAWIKEIAGRVNPNSRGNVKGTSDRAFKELSPLIAMADKERSGILGTLDQALLPFKNAAVKQRTSACDFTPADMRGMFDPEEGRMKPVTLFICVNQAEAPAFANITALLYEVMSRFLLSYGPDETNEKTGQTMGPFPVCFAMDEFAKLPKIDAVITGPDLGRSKKLSYMLVAQDYSQIEKTYGKELVRTINGTTAVKYVLAQNEPESIKTIIGMVGKTTMRRHSHSQQEGISRNANPFSWNASETIEEVDFLRDKDVTGMPEGTHIVIVQKFMNRPMKLKTALWFKDPEMAPKVWYKGTGPVADKYLPNFIHAARVREHMARHARLAADNASIVSMAAASAVDATNNDDFDDAEALADRLEE